jgi:hypothetical protein
MDSPFGEDRLALLLVQGFRAGGGAHLLTQLVESAGAKDHQGASRHLAGVAKLVGTSRGITTSAPACAGRTK